MLSPLVTERITTDDWYCEHDSGCLKRVNLPADIAEMLMADKWLILIVDGCHSAKAGELVKEGAGFKVHRLGS